jgi:hypothetical protein
METYYVVEVWIEHDKTVPDYWFEKSYTKGHTPKIALDKYEKYSKSKRKTRIIKVTREVIENE